MVDIAGDGWIGSMKGDRYPTEKVDEITDGGFGETMELPKTGSGAMKLDGNLVVEFTGIRRDKDKLAVRPSKFLMSSYVRSHLSSEEEFSQSSSWSGVSEVSESGVLVFLKCQKLQGSELGFLYWFEMVRDYSKNSLEKE